MRLSASPFCAWVPSNMIVPGMSCFMAASPFPLLRNNLVRARGLEHFR
jgi:hypothetical protein